MARRRKMSTQSGICPIQQNVSEEAAMESIDVFDAVPDELLILILTEVSIQH